jgi:hypothetical protein
MKEILKNLVFDKNFYLLLIIIYIVYKVFRIIYIYFIFKTDYKKFEGDYAVITGIYKYH